MFGDDSEDEGVLYYSGSDNYFERLDNRLEVFECFDYEDNDFLDVD